MSKTFRPWDVDQIWLLPPSVQDLVPAGHMAHFVRDTVREGLNLSAVMASYEEERGNPPYHPAMMVALLCIATRRASTRRAALPEGARSGWISPRSPGSIIRISVPSASSASGIWWRWRTCSSRC